MLRCKAGENVLWCDFVVNADGEVRVVSCNVSVGVRVVYWDIETHTPVCIMPLPSTNLQSSLGNNLLWQQKWSSKRESSIVRGLKPIGLSTERDWLGLVSSAQNTAIMWNAPHAVEELNLRIPENLVRMFYKLCPKTLEIGCTAWLRFAHSDFDCDS